MKTGNRNLSHASLEEQQKSGWTFLTNHCHVLVCLDRDPHMRLREIARLVGITERAVHRLIVELEEAGVLNKSRDGRRNHYEVNYGAPLRHPLEANRTLGDLLKAVGEDTSLRRSA